MDKGTKDGNGIYTGWGDPHREAMDNFQLHLFEIIVSIVLFLLIWS